MLQFNGLNAAEFQQRVERFKADANTPVQGPVVDFGQRLKEAVQRKISSRRDTASRTAPPESFGRKVADATQRILAGRGKTAHRASPQGATK